MSIIPIFIPHAGCPHQCVFCNQKAISGQKTAAVAGARAQIDAWMPRLRTDVRHEAAFYGGSFTGLALPLQEELLKLTDELRERGVIGSVRLSTRPDYINEEVLRLLQAHGVTLVELGAQSLDDAVLAAAERGHTAAQVAAAVRLLQKYGFGTGLQLMVGLPRQDMASVEATAAQAVLLRPDITRIYPLLVIKDTPLASAYAKGEFAPLALEEAVEQAACLYRQLTEAGVRVIRVGLQPDAELCAPGNIIAGPFHPSMGELVQARVLRQRLTPELDAQYAAGRRRLELRCAPRGESKLRGLKNCNLSYWRQRYPGAEIFVVRE